MATNVTKLSRLSRNKTTGNFIICLILIISVMVFLSVIGPNFTSDSDKTTFLGTIFLCFLLSYIVNKQMRKPFFLEISRYQEELIDRRLDIQNAGLQLELIEPMQPITLVQPVLHQVDDLQEKISALIKQISFEISANIPPIRNPHIYEEIQDIVKFADQVLEDISIKRKKIIFIANVRQIVLKSVNKQLRRPRNEIETDYLLFKVQNQVHDRIVDDVLVQRIVTHALSQNEIVGRMHTNEVGEKILTVDRVANYKAIGEKINQNSDFSDQYCLICRHSILQTESLVGCPTCQNVFHRNHLLEWLKVFNQCPICHQRLTMFSNPS
ncbi:MAG: RING finger protein [Candidatus Hodarchaeales archaeon]